LQDYCSISNAARHKANSKKLVANDSVASRARGPARPSDCNVIKWLLRHSRTNSYIGTLL